MLIALQGQAAVADALSARDDANTARAESARRSRASARRRRESLALLSADLAAAVVPILRALASMKLQADDTCRLEREAIDRGARLIIALVEDAAGATTTSGS